MIKALSLSLAFSAALLTSITGASAAPVSIKGAEDFPIAGDYQAGAEGSPGVLFLHQCNRDRHMYAPVATLLEKEGIHTLAIDFRLFGDSQAGDYTRARLEAMESREEQMTFWRTMARELWGDDVKAAYDYLRGKVGDAPIGVIGASCGGAQAIRLASERDVAVLSLFSAATSPRTMEVYETLPSMPTLFITSEAELPQIRPYFDKASHSANRLIEYKGDGHGEPLMTQDASLAGTIALWFSAHLDTK